MGFLVDECTGPRVAQWLSEQGHDVFSVYQEARGSDDDSIIRKACEEDWILITNDKDFGEKVFRGRHPHQGIIFLRLADNRANNKIEVLKSYSTPIQPGLQVSSLLLQNQEYASPSRRGPGRFATGARPGAVTPDWPAPIRPVSPSARSRCGEG